MKFALLFNEPAGGFERRTDPTQAEAYWSAWGAYIKAMREAGVMTEGAGLQPPAEGARVRIRDGARDVQDGPYADAKEQLGGFVILENVTIEDAYAWAAKAPCVADGFVEVRPLMAPAQESASEPAEAAAG